VSAPLKKAVNDPEWRKHADTLRDLFGCGCPIYARVLITHPTTKGQQKNQEFITSFFNRCKGMEWIDKSPAEALLPIHATKTQFKPLSPAERQHINRAATPFRFEL
jgi:hypothetical protein